MARPQQEDRYLVEFGRNLSKLRLSKKMTQDDLATKTGLSADTIGAIEQGRRWARLTTLHKLADGLGTPTNELFIGLNSKN